MAQVAAEGCAVLQRWRPKNLRCIGGSRGLRCAVVVAAEGCAALQWWQLQAVAKVVPDKGLHCNGSSQGAALHR